MFDLAREFDTLRVIGICAWLFCVGCIAPAVWRLIHFRGRYFDPIWGVVFLLSVNRLTYLTQISREMSAGSAAALAIAMGLFSLSYQRNDRRG